jgi:eukaryotic-like serine/threonine-protein kinase
MAPKPTDACLLEELLDEVIASYLDALALGHPPAQQELLALHPELAAELTRFFENRDRFDRLASPLREMSGQDICPRVLARPDRASVAPDPGDTRTPTFEGHAPGWHDAQPPPNLNDYEILEELGRGGMGVVYKAWQRSLKRLVALKVLRGSGATREELERFRAEAEIVARLEHLNIVRIHEVGRADGVPFLSLEFVAGGSLSRCLDRSPLPARAAAELTGTVARAVHHAHECGVIHRDLKPANILLQLTNDQGSMIKQEGQPADLVIGNWSLVIPKVTDFGLAKRLDGPPSQTRTGVVLGTPSYMAPEQAQGQSKAVGPAADVWALGAILYECLTGRPPFRAVTPMDTLLQVIQDDPVPPARLQPTCPRDLETICLKCLQKDPHRRYASAEELADDLRRFLNGEPIRARPTGVWERSVKFVRRHPAIAALVAVSTLAALVLALVGVGYVAGLEEAVKKGRISEGKLRDTNDQLVRVTVRAKYRPLLDQARTALASKAVKDKQLDSAETLAREVQAAVRNEPALADLKTEAKAQLEEVGRLRGALNNYQQLFRKLDEALFQLNRQLFTGLDGAESLMKARKEAREALALFRVNSEAEGGPVLDRDYSPQEKEQITLGCYRTLLILADALVRPSFLPAVGGQRAPVDRGALRRALLILDRANRLVPPTRAYLAWRLRRARYLAQLGETVEAREARAASAGLRPVDPFDAFLVGSDRWLEGQKPQQALRELEDALSGDGDLFWARLILAVGLKPRDPAQARAHLTVCISQRSEFVWTYLIRGSINAEKPLSDFKAAETDFKRAAGLIEHKPDRSAEYVLLVNRGVLRIRQHSYTAAIDDLKKAVALRPDQFQGFLNLGVAYREQGLKRAAVRLLGASLQPDRLAAALGVSISDQDWGQWKEARDALDQAIAVRPDLALLYRERAQLCLLCKDRKGRECALRDFQQAITAPEKAGVETYSICLECGLIHYQEGRFAEAVRACDVALRLKRGYAPAHRLEGEALFELAEKEGPGPRKQQFYREALRSFDRYLVCGPPVAEVYLARALAHAGLGDYAAVVGDYTQTLVLRPKDPALHEARGWAYLAIGAAPQARDDFTEAIRLAPRNSHSHNGLGYALVRLGKAAEGVREARKALALGPPTRRLFVNAARVLAQAAAIEEARTPRRAVAGESYRAEAVECLVRALASLGGEKKRAEFWERYIRPDSLRPGGALYPLRRSPRFADLVERYERPGRRPGAL